MARIRTFIAVDIGETLRQRVVALQQKLARTGSDVKWVEENNIHLTLLFLGEVNQLDLVPICRILKEELQTVPPFALSIAGLGAFPTPRRPKILWAGVSEGINELRQIHQLLEQPLLDLGCYRREVRAYTPHLTLGRLAQEDNSGEWAKLLAQHAEWEGGATTIDEVLVMSSELRRNGPLYTVMGRTQLG